jgi:5-(aminomethyl)-3-furanmethanol phosphate kinase
VIDTVVKVGGSLGRGTSLAELGPRLAELGRAHRLLVVPGGGEFADLVRQYDARLSLSPGVAHWMAVLAMEQYGHLLGDMTPGCGLVRTLAEVEACVSNGAIAILLPHELLRRADPLPHSWSVTSDSIAAWLAREVGAQMLVLLKDSRGMAGLAAAACSAPGAMSIAELAAADGVDDHLAALVGAAAFDLWILDGARPERLHELLETGRTEGVRLERPAL